MNISFTGKACRSAGGLFFQAIVGDRIVSYFVTSGALALHDRARQGVANAEIYRTHRGRIEPVTSDLIRAGTPSASGCAWP